MSDWSPDEGASRRILQFALQNAVEYDGAGQVGSVMGRIMGEMAELRPHGKAVTPFVAKAVAEANALAASSGLDAVRARLAEVAPELLEKRVHERKEGLPDLPNLQPGVQPVLRFAPNPNGPLSFGHSRGVVVNALLAAQHDGLVVLRFDDTDTSVKPPDPRAYDWITEDYEWLTGRKPDRVVRVSEHLDRYHEVARDLLTAGHAYVCECSGDAFSELRKQRTDCPHRDRESQTSLDLWDQMLDGTLEPGSCVVRLKTDMTLPNPALRDWPMLRIQWGTHPVVGDRHKVWPLLDFESAVEDHDQGVTHIVRGKDLMDSTRKQTLLYQILGWTYPETLYWGRVKLHEFGSFSTSSMRKGIEEGTFSGWDDVRLPTIRAMRRRGIQAEALARFWVEMGLTQKDVAASAATFESHNTSVVDATAPRLAFVREPHATLGITHIPGEERPLGAKAPVHPEDPEMGVRHVPLVWDGKRTAVVVEQRDLDRKTPLRLKDLADLDTGDDDAYHLGDSEPSGRPIVHWLPAEGKGAGIPTVLLLPEGEELHEVRGLLEPHEHPVGTIVQLERVGYARLEAPEADGTQRLVFLHG